MKHTLEELIADPVKTRVALAELLGARWIDIEFGLRLITMRGDDPRDSYSVAWPVKAGDVAFSPTVPNWPLDLNAVAEVVGAMDQRNYDCYLYTLCGGYDWRTVDPRTITEATAHQRSAAAVLALQERRER